MKIDTNTIDGYAEMTAEQKLAALEAFEYEDNSSEIERLKNAVSKANSEAADWKKKHNALLSEEDQKKQEDAAMLESLKSELETLRKDKTVSEYTAKYIALGYDKDLAIDTAKAMADGNMEKVFANGEKHKAAMEKKIKEDLMSKTPKPGGNGNGNDNEKDSSVAQAEKIGKAKAEANKASADVMKHYIK